MQPEATGTVIQKAPSASGVKAIAAKDGIIAINIKSSRMLLAYGFLRKIFEVFEKYKTPIDMVTTSEVAVSVTIDNGANMNKILRELEPFGTTDVEYDQTIVSIVGNEIVETRDVLGKIFEALSQVPVRMVSYGGSKHNVSVLIPSSFKINTLQALNKKLFGLE